MQFSKSNQPAPRNSALYFCKAVIYKNQYYEGVNIIKWGKKSFQQMLLDLVIHVQENEVGPLRFAIHKN